MKYLNVFDILLLMAVFSITVVSHKNKIAHWIALLPSTIHFLLLFFPSIFLTIKKNISIYNNRVMQYFLEEDGGWFGYMYFSTICVLLKKKPPSGDLWLVWTTNPIVEGRSKRSDLNLVNRTFLTIKDFV